MRKIALLIVPVLALAFGADASAATSKALQQAAQRSFNGLKGTVPKGSLDNARLDIHQHGTKATVAIQKFGRAPGPVVIGYKPSTWYTVKMAEFVNKRGTWAKQGKWDQVMYALGVHK